LFEKCILTRINTYLRIQEGIPSHQFGFREKHGTIEQVNRITAEIRNAFEKREYCTAIFLDVSQAFDRVWLEGLMYKIKTMLPCITHKLLESYLYDRKFAVRCNTDISDEFTVGAGVPQGSVLGPTLYVLYTADIPTSTRTFTLNRQNCPPLTLNNTLLPQANEVTYLGVHLDRRLTWSRHIEAKRTHLKLKASSLHWLINARSPLCLEYKVLLYNSVLKPIWMYGSQLWGNASNS
ncbi:hypothetical protein KR067_003611, partial [Drosophila pandora]